MLHSSVGTVLLLCIIRHLDFLGFRQSPLAAAQLCILARSAFNLSTCSPREFIGLLNKSCTSSAYMYTLQYDSCCGKSLAYIENSIGPKIEPCGTPLGTGRTSEIKLLEYTDCVRPVRYQLMKRVDVGEKFKKCSSFKLRTE